MRHIAAVRDHGGAFLTPGVDLMTYGALVRTVALDPGCGPSLSCSPDSPEVAIATRVQKCPPARATENPVTRHAQGQRRLTRTAGVERGTPTLRGRGPTESR
jgi:hypothetical protein